ncbi:type IIL restriction-modification enzyme MmeI [Kutzneria sp. NPDC051319]|uniref:Eco57I restriction-modification methylase domain-containing protein n=1 Tax=Kutzneria sp. NPDC051319 TaxID=3155047 RepID=UPI00341A41D4
MAGTARRGRVPDGVQQHREWLSLVDTNGPFLSLPVLRTAWPTLDALEKPAREQLRREHANWQVDPVAAQRNWVDYMLGELLGWASELRWEEELQQLALDVDEHDTRIAPTFALVEPGGQVDAASIRLLGLMCPAGSNPTGRVKDEAWTATPADRLAQLCRARDVPLGLVTDGRWWTLIRAPRNGTTTTATFDAVGWNDAAERDVVRAFRSILCRRRFFGVPADETLVALLAASEGSQEEITEALGVQVRQAVELLVAAIGRADTAQRERGEADLQDVDAEEIYRAAVSVMMRIVFLLFAEERKMLPSDNALYAESYSVGRLCEALEKRSFDEGEDDLEHSFAAWHRLRALFHAVYWGVDHPRLSMYPHDGSLFDSERYSWLPDTIDDRTMLHMLRAVQYVETGTGRSRERRKLSFRELEVEQIGYVYEGLLGYDGYRAHDVIVSLIGRTGFEEEVSLRELEDAAARTGIELAAKLAEDYKSSGIGSAGALQRRLGPLPAGEREEHLRVLLAASRGDRDLAERLLPFSRIIRRDLRGQPVVIMPGELFVTESSYRKNTGAHYTPRHLAERVVQDALEPLVYKPGPVQTADRSSWKLKTSKEILALKVADIAMGSGAFLVSAAFYLGDRLVEARAREGDRQALDAEISRAVGEHQDDPVVIDARRSVIERCLYGVDINPTAVEIAKVSLWLVSMDTQRPFTFLDDRLVAGDSLLGITSTDQLRHMHIDPARGRELHHDLFYWTKSTDALLHKSADTRRRIMDLEQLGGPLDWLDDRRKLLKESRDDLRELSLIADVLTGAVLANASDGLRGIDRAAVEAAYLADGIRRDGDTEAAQAKATSWLRTDSVDPGLPRQPVHWPLVFADVFEEGGFDAVIGNQPFLGGQMITGVLGRAYREYLVHVVGRGVRGSADLIAYFALRSHDLIRKNGHAGLIATKTLAQGDTREVGLDQLLTSGVVIRKSIKSTPWPSRSSALECCIITTTREVLGEASECLADGVVVSAINSSLDLVSRAAGQPYRLIVNQGSAFQGSNILGLGFTMDPELAERLISIDNRNAEVLFPYLSGRDLNSLPDCSASRWVINFHNWPEERAREYEDCYSRVTRLVKPERGRNNREVYRVNWWQYAEKRPTMTDAISDLDRILAIARVSRTAMPVLVSARQVLSEMIVVFASEDPALLALLSSVLHYWWAKAYASSMKADLRYTPSDVFETFPLPVLTNELRVLGGELDEFRREVMLCRGAGLTKTYNLVFDPSCEDDDIVELRAIHRSIDEATVRAYGWEERIAKVGGLDHGFHPVGRETRYTIGPAAQREVLDSLLELNHERHAEEVASGVLAKPKRKPRKPPNGQGLL